MKYQVHTFGCKVNTYDTGLLQKNMGSSGFCLDPSAKIHVLNTCAVTAEATKEAVKSIRRIKAKDPFATVVVTGCAAQVDTWVFENLPGADLVVANSHKGLLPFLLDQHFKGELSQRVFKSNIFRKEDLEEGGGIEPSHTRAFLKIQDGCNSFCSYCIIPFARGKSRSIPIRDLVRRVRELSTQGIQETVLTGVHIGDYEDDSGASRLEDLVENLLKNTSMPRFRLTSLEPLEVTDRLLALYQDPRMCRHFHMSIQSANSEILNRMKRSYNQLDVEASLQKIAVRVPGSFVGMDVIVGFPTESETHFEDTYVALANTPWTRLHVFPYSERQGTKATTLQPVVPLQERKKRSQKLRELSLHRYQSEALKQVGTEKQVLILKNEAKGAQGLSRDYWPVKIPRLENIGDVSGQELRLQITAYDHSDANKMEGVLVAETPGTSLS